MTCQKPSGLHPPRRCLTFSMCLTVSGPLSLATAKSFSISGRYCLRTAGSTFSR